MLCVEALTIKFQDESVVHGIDFNMDSGEILGLVGESGSGKTVTAQAVLGLIRRRGAVATGRVLFEGQDLLTRTPVQMQQVLGKRIGMVFQEPMTALNPLMKVGRQVEEVLRIHTRQKPAALRAAALRALEEMEISDSARVYGQYPHELSGGMRQRAMIAAAMVLEPKLLICDEPTTALDVTTQAQILALLERLNRERGVSLLFISHDLGVVRRLCHRAIVMQGGHIVEQGDAATLFASPQASYTKQLLASLPERGRFYDSADFGGF